MHAGRALGVIIAAALLAGAHPGDASGSRESAETIAPCSEAWLRWVEEKVPTGDGHGHGPDVGSDEWKSVVEFKLGIRGDPDVPARDGDEWCRYIDRILASRGGSPAPDGTGPEMRCGRTP